MIKAPKGKTEGQKFEKKSTRGGAPGMEPGEPKERSAQTYQWLEGIARNVIERKSPQIGGRVE